MSPRILPGAILAAVEDPGAMKVRAAAGLPEWVTASVVYDVDGVLLLEVLSARPSRGVASVLGSLADSLSELGWREQQHGALPWTRPDGVGCPGGWITWSRGGEG
jgi:hypothetical protein